MQGISFCLNFVYDFFLSADRWKQWDKHIHQVCNICHSETSQFFKTLSCGPHLLLRSWLRKTLWIWSHPQSIDLNPLIALGVWILKPCVQYYEIKGIRQFHISWELIEEEICFLVLRLGFPCLKYNMPELDVLWENRRLVWFPSVTSFLPFLLFLLLQTRELPFQLWTLFHFLIGILFFSAAKFHTFNTMTFGAK